MLVLSEIRCILRPRGQLLIADWEETHNPPSMVGFFLVQCLDGYITTKDHAAGRLPNFIGEAGFECVSINTKVATQIGSIDTIHAVSASEH